MQDKNKFFIILLSSLLCMMLSSYSQENKLKYSNVRICLSQQFTISDIINLGIDLEGAAIKGTYIDNVVLDDYEINILNMRNISYEINISDLEQYYKNRLVLSDKNLDLVQKPENFGLGSMGGYYKLDEIYGQFDSMKSKFPEYIIETDTIGYSVEKRPVLFYRIGADSTNPQVLLTCLHHAREPGGIMSTVYFLWDLLEKAGQGNPGARYILENRSIFIIPAVNPDGYYFNQLNSPQGGGLWRKNRRRFNDTTFGVDLNRNYGPENFWNSPNQGSSTDSSQTTYRGKTPFSEPEVASIRDFVKNHSFKTALNYHTFGNYILYPWSYIDNETPDSVLYKSLTEYMCLDNLYLYGKDSETIMYNTRGSSDDFMYNPEPGKNKILAMTAEAGNPMDGFWPPTSRIIPIALDNLKIISQIILCAGANPRVVKLTPDYISATNEFFLKTWITNLGLEATEFNLQLSLKSLDSNFIVINADRILSKLNSAESLAEQFEVINLSPGFRNGSFVNFETSLQYDGIVTKDIFKIQLFSHTTYPIFINGNLNGSWDLGKWGKEFSEETGDFVLSDSPDGIYKDSSSNYLVMKESLKIDTLPITLEFTSKWETEPYYDCCIVQASTDAGYSWKFLKTKKMLDGLGIKNSRMTLSSVGFTGFSKGWFTQECSLDSYKGKNILLRFAVLSDKGKNLDGWQISDINLKVYDKLEYKGIADFNVKHQSEIKIGPSPLRRGELITGSIYRANNKTDGKLIEMMNEIGERVVLINLEKNTTTFYIPTDKLSSGIYFIRIFSGSAILYNGKIIIL